METVESSLRSFIESELRNSDCELVDLEVKKQRGLTLVRVYADRSGGITLGEIAEATRNIRDRLDQSDIYGAEYRLEVSSPGPTRALEMNGDLTQFKGRSVMLYLKKGERKRGSILNANSDCLVLRTEEGDTEEVGRDEVEYMHLLFTRKQ